MLNNRIGRFISLTHPNANMKEMAQAALKYFRNEGLWVAEQQSDGTYKVVQEKLSEAQYRQAASRLTRLDENGFASNQK